jgi:hypothetical protein
MLLLKPMQLLRTAHLVSTGYRTQALLMAADQLLDVITSAPSGIMADAFEPTVLEPSARSN